MDWLEEGKSNNIVMCIITEDDNKSSKSTENKGWALRYCGKA
jgi:hypothetical protein